MRVATYNVHDCIGRDRVYDPLRILEVIRQIDADVIALQEMTLDDAGEILQLIVEYTGMDILDGTLIPRGIGRYGNILLSRIPIRVAQIYQLPQRGRELRGVIRAELSWEDQVIRVFATHLGLSRRERRYQIDTLASLCGSAGPPAILLGDLNVWYGPAEMKPLVKRGFFHYAVRSFPNWPRPIFALDRIMVQKPIRIKSCIRYQTGQANMASDHYPLVAEISFKGNPASPV